MYYKSNFLFYKYINNYKQSRFELSHLEVGFRWDFSEKGGTFVILA